MTSYQIQRTPILEISPSQWINFGWYTLPIITGIISPVLGVITILIAIYKYFEVRTWRYKCTDRCIEEEKGVFSVIQQEVQYFRIKSIMVEKPFLMRIVGLSIIHIISSERFKPKLVLYGISNGENVKYFLSQNTIEWRKKHGVGDYDIF